MRFRSAPLSTRLGVLFGGFSLNFSAVFFAFGMTLFWVFGADSSSNFYEFWFAETAVAPSVVLGTFGTNASENDRPITGYKYRFTTPDGRQYEGEAYSSTESAEGDVEYIVDDPARRGNHHSCADRPVAASRMTRYGAPR